MKKFINKTDTTKFVATTSLSFANCWHYV